MSWGGLKGLDGEVSLPRQPSLAISTQTPHMFKPGPWGLLLRLVLTLRPSAGLVAPAPHASHTQPLPHRQQL